MDNRRCTASRARESESNLKTTICVPAVYAGIRQGRNRCFARDYPVKLHKDLNEERWPGRLLKSDPIVILRFLIFSEGYCNVKASFSANGDSTILLTFPQIERKTSILTRKSFCAGCTYLPWLFQFIQSVTEAYIRVCQTHEYSYLFRDQNFAYPRKEEFIYMYLLFKI